MKNEFRTVFAFVRKYEFDREKSRNQGGTERDISHPFSTLDGREVHV
jgi:hypothetical protein